MDCQRVYGGTQLIQPNIINGQLSSTTSSMTEHRTSHAEVCMIRLRDECDFSGSPSRYEYVPLSCILHAGPASLHASATAAELLAMCIVFANEVVQLTLEQHETSLHWATGACTARICQALIVTCNASASHTDLKVPTGTTA